MRADEPAWAAYQAELNEWDSTLLDGLEDESVEWAEAFPDGGNET